jgi:hypothetical protein
MLDTGYYSAKGIAHSVQADNSVISVNSNAWLYTPCALPLKPHSAFRLPNSILSAYSSVGQQPPYFFAVGLGNYLRLTQRPFSFGGLFGQDMTAA